MKWPILLSLTPVIYATNHNNAVFEGNSDVDYATILKTLGIKAANADGRPNYDVHVTFQHVFNDDFFRRINAVYKHASLYAHAVGKTHSSDSLIQKRIARADALCEDYVKLSDFYTTTGMVLRQPDLYNVCKTKKWIMFLEERHFNFSFTTGYVHMLSGFDSSNSEYGLILNVLGYMKECIPSKNCKAFKDTFKISKSKSDEETETETLRKEYQPCKDARLVELIQTHLWTSLNPDAHKTPNFKQNLPHCKFDLENAALSEYTQDFLLERFEQQYTKYDKEAKQWYVNSYGFFKSYRDIDGFHFKHLADHYYMKEGILASAKNIYEQSHIEYSLFTKLSYVQTLATQKENGHSSFIEVPKLSAKEEASIRSLYESAVGYDKDFLCIFMMDVFPLQHVEDLTQLPATWTARFEKYNIPKKCMAIVKDRAERLLTI